MGAKSHDHLTHQAVYYLFIDLFFDFGCIFSESTEIETIMEGTDSTLSQDVSVWYRATVNAIAVDESGQYACLGGYIFSPFTILFMHLIYSIF